MADKTVQVALRVRPLVHSEMSRGCKDVLETFLELSQVRLKDTDKAFTYNHIFGVESSQDEVYEKCVKQMIDNLFTGYNLTVLAYGQTGSGKTYTMGTTYNGEGEMGVIPRAVTEIFERIRDNFAYHFTISVSFMELYQETLYDLLSAKTREQCILEIREDPNKGILIPGLTQVPVHTVKNVFEELIRGSRSRVTGATNMNAQSSRSHAIFTISLIMQSKTDGAEKTAKFHLVDLAGSERPKKTGAVGNTFKEGVNINKGLLVLGNVISALGDEKQAHNFVPYRDSNLTRLLKDSLGGNSITLMIACVSPADYNVEETMSTLRYADRARRIQNKPVVNQDPKAAEINMMKKIIQELRLQIVGQGGPAICSNEITDMREENLRLQYKIRDLTLQLSSTLNDNTGLLEKLMILQNANETLHSKIQALKSEYEVTLQHINVSLSQNDQEAIKKNVEKLQELQEQFVVIDTEQKKAENEILSHEQNIDLHNSQSGQFKDEGDMSRDQENYTNKQMALNIELQEITKKLAMKEHLARQITTNTHDLVDYQDLAENEAKILTLQKEKEELVQQLRSAQAPPSAKMSDQRRKRVQELEAQIQDLHKKVQEQARLIKLKEKDVTKINQLNNEILQMKQTRVKLIRKMREESERFRSWKTQRERELAKLKQQDMKKQNQIVKMEVMHSKQQNVLKRKVEEAVALNKRLKDALALRKATQESKNGKGEKIGQWIKQEVDVHMHLIEAEVTLAGLVEDRATLQQQLDTIRENPEELNESQIQNIEEDIEMRSLQIQDLQQKLMDSDEENKKSKFDNIQTMAESKIALKTLLEQVTDIKKSEVMTKNKLMETQSYVNDLKQKSESQEKVIRIMEYKQAEDVSSIQKDYEDKIAVLLRQLRGVEVKDASEELKRRCSIQNDKIDSLDKANQELMAKLYESQQQVEELKEKIETITHMAQESQTKPSVLEELHTPDQNPRKKTIKIKQQRDSTYIIENQENVDQSFEDDIDDIEKDPDWKRTPIGKWILERKRKTLQRDTSEGDSAMQTTLKRTSEGGCTCAKTNCSMRCGCRKAKRNCTSGCKCSKSCLNKVEEIISESDTPVEVDDKRPRLLKQKLFYFKETKEART